MSASNTITSLLREHKTLLIVITIGIILLEVEIFAFAAMKTGRKSSLHILDQQGTLIHVTDGDNLSTFNKYYFEKTFGPLDQYQVRLVTQEQPFPFRAWFTAALGIPIGAVLLFGFIVRAYLTIIHGDTRPDQSDKARDKYTAPHGRFMKIIDRTRRLNIFIFGLVIFLVTVSYWIVPNVIAYLGKAGLNTLVRYKEIFLTVMGLLTAIVVWIIYLRYLLAKKSIASQTEIQKYRLQLEMTANHRIAPELDYRPTVGKGNTTDVATPKVLKKKAAIDNTEGDQVP